MMVWLKGLATALVLVAVLWAALAAYGASRWSAGTRALTQRLDAALVPLSPTRYDAARELDGLPLTVPRFFRAALADGQSMVAALELDHRGTFNLAAEGPDRWVPFTSTQRVTTRRPGFVWDARMPILPGITVRVHDAYIAGEGLLHPAVMGLVSLAELRGTSPEPDGIAQGELMRWFAEAAWYPTALLPSQGVRWIAIDDQSAEATFADGTLGATLTFRFDATTGLIESVRAEARGRTVGKRVVMTLWEGRWSDYAQREGMWVPSQGEVVWLAPEGRRAYWRGKLTRLEVNAAKQASVQR